MLHSCCIPSFPYSNCAVESKTSFIFSISVSMSPFLLRIAPRQLREMFLNAYFLMALVTFKFIQTRCKRSRTSSSLLQSCGKSKENFYISSKSIYYVQFRRLTSYSSFLFGPKLVKITFPGICCGMVSECDHPKRDWFKLRPELSFV